MNGISLSSHSEKVPPFVRGITLRPVPKGKLNEGEAAVGHDGLADDPAGFG